MASAGEADYLVTGDRRGVLSLGRYERTQIVTVRRILEVLKR
jgi:predicted nucleic acid-binding protein